MSRSQSMHVTPLGPGHHNISSAETVRSERQRRNVSWNLSFYHVQGLKFRVDRRHPPEQHTEAARQAGPAPAPAPGPEVITDRGLHPEAVHQARGRGGQNSLQ